MTAAATTDASLARDLRAIRDLWPRLLAPAKDGKGGSGRHDRPPLAPGALSLRREVPEQLASWMLLIVEDFDADARGVDTMDAAVIAGWMLPWCEAMAGHEAATDYGSELALIVERMERCALGAKVHRFEVGPCPQVWGEGEGRIVSCTGDLIAHVHLDGEPSVVRCTVQPEHSWTGRDWGELGHKISPGGVHKVTVGEASALTGVAKSTIRDWVRHERLQRYDVVDGRHYKVDYSAVRSLADRMEQVAS